MNNLYAHTTKWELVIAWTELLGGTRGVKARQYFYSFASNEQYIDIDLWLTHSYNYSGLTEEIEGEPIRQK